MRRHADDIPRSERGLVTACWALSGYGLRASRALAWLGAAMLLTLVLLMAFGLAQDAPQQTATGTVPGWSGPGLPHRSDPLCCRTARRVQPPAVGTHAADDPG